MELTANDMEPHRIERLEEVRDRLAEILCGPFLPLALHDHKGDLTVTWRDESAREWFGKLAHDLWIEQGEYTIENVVADEVPK